VIEGMDVLELLMLCNLAENPELPPGDKIITVEIKELS
jgi:hypothetical protein